MRLVALGIPIALLTTSMLLVSGLGAAQTPFTEEAIARGVNFVTPVGTWGGSFGRGVALNDFDGDRDLDLILTGRADGAIGIYENDGSGNFTDRTGGIPVSSVEFCGLSAADYDGDGDLDLYVSHWLGPNVLLRNDGAFVFTDVTAAAGPALADVGPATGTAWGDYDGDGWQDLYLCNYTNTVNTEPNRLFRNRGDGTFESVGAALGVEDGCLSFQPGWFDYDRDGDLDLYLSNDKGSVFSGCSNRLWENTGAGFIDRSAASGTNVTIDSMGLALGDYDGNLLQDIYCTNLPPGNPLLLNLGGGSFFDSAVSYGVAVFSTGWGTHFFDYDHDGDNDIFVAASPLGNRLLRQDPGPTAADLAVPLGLHLVGDSFCTAVGDIDGDGDVDLVVQQYLDPVRIYINHSGVAGNWLKVRLHGAWPNLHAVGAAVDVSGPGGPTIYQEVRSGVSFKSSSALALHFGLGSRSAVDISVTWPGGGTTQLTAVAVNQAIDVYEVTTDCDGNGALDYADIQQGAADQNTNWVLDSCEEKFIRGDCNGDGVLNIGDPICSLQDFVGAVAADCRRALDSNFDGNVDIADPVFVLLHLFANGPAPAMPFPQCGVTPLNGAPALDCLLSSPLCL